MEIICLSLGLIILIVVNIVLGSMSAMFHYTFNRERFLHGFIKAGIVVLCFAATYLVGFLNPDIVAVEVNGVKVTVETAIYLVVLVGYYHYAKQVIEKLTSILKGNMFVKDLELFPVPNDKNGKNGKEQAPCPKKDGNKPGGDADSV